MEEINSLTELEKKRYSLQIKLPGIGMAGQEKIKNAKVLVVGIGGLGSQVLQYLAAMGVGTIGFLDYDIIEEENLNHQIYYGMEDIGKLKAVITRKRLVSVNQLIQFNMLNVELNSDNAGSIIPGYDLIIDSTNNSAAHYIINDACIKYGKIMVFGGVYNMEGRLSVFNYQMGPSYRCAWPDDKTQTSSEKKVTGMPGILPGLTGLYLANEVIKIITGSSGILSGIIMYIDVFSNQNRFEKINRNPANF